MKSKEASVKHILVSGCGLCPRVGESWAYIHKHLRQLAREFCFNDLFGEGSAGVMTFVSEVSVSRQAFATEAVSSSGRALSLWIGAIVQSWLQHSQL